MSIIATVSVDAADFALGGVVTDESGVRVRLERAIPLGDAFVPYLWADDGSVDAIEDALRTEADVASFAIIDRTDSEALVRVEWTPGTGSFLDAVSEKGGTVVEGVGEAGRWRFELRFPEHDQLTAFYRQCADEDIDVELERVHSPGPPRGVETGVALTEPQRETLRTALEEGYFDVPRGINLVELAEELGVSDSAVSQRLRRGIAALLSTTLRDDEDVPDTP